MKPKQAFFGDLINLAYGAFNYAFKSFLLIVLAVFSTIIVLNIIK